MQRPDILLKLSSILWNAYWTWLWLHTGQHSCFVYWRSRFKISGRKRASL